MCNYLFLVLAPDSRWSGSQQACGYLVVGLINNILEWNEKSYSYYVTTEIAKTVLESLFDTIIPTISDERDSTLTKSKELLYMMTKKAMEEE